jgi:hypothetical protein
MLLLGGCLYKEKNPRRAHAREKLYSFVILQKMQENIPKVLSNHPPVLKFYSNADENGDPEVFALRRER